MRCLVCGKPGERQYCNHECEALELGESTAHNTMRGDDTRSYYGCGPVRFYKRDIELLSMTLDEVPEILAGKRWVDVGKIDDGIRRVVDYAGSLSQPSSDTVLIQTKYVKEQHYVTNWLQ